MENDDFFQVQEFDKIHHQKHVSLLDVQSETTLINLNAHLAAQLIRQALIGTRFTG